MTDFRALCVELTDCLEKTDWPHRYKHVLEQWIYIARKALAEPEPEGPSDEELMKLLPEDLHIATQAARWGADQELEACSAEVSFFNTRSLADKIRTTRRPKPPSLKEQSLALIDKIQSNKEMWQTDDLDVVRRALESLPDE